MWAFAGAGSTSDLDEYDDDDDPGFLRLDVVGQEAALGCECHGTSTQQQPQAGCCCLPADCCYVVPAVHCSMRGGLVLVSGLAELRTYVAICPPTQSSWTT